MKNIWTSPCAHLETAQVRIIDTAGRTHVMEQCEHCGLNARGPGVWLEWKEIHGRVEDLPLAYDARRGRQLPSQ